MLKIADSYQERIIQTLQETSEPLDTEKIRIEAGIGNWNTALKHCLELLIEGKIGGIKTSKSWVFWIDLEKNTQQSMLEKKAGRKPD